MEANAPGWKGTWRMPSSLAFCVVRRWPAPMLVWTSSRPPRKLLCPEPLSSKPWLPGFQQSSWPRAGQASWSNMALQVSSARKPMTLSVGLSLFWRTVSCGGGWLWHLVFMPDNGPGPAFVKRCIEPTDLLYVRRHFRQHNFQCRRLIHVRWLSSDSNRRSAFGVSLHTNASRSSRETAKSALAVFDWP